MKRLVLVMFAWVVVFFRTAGQDSTVFPAGQDREIALDEQLNAMIPGDIMVINEAGDTVPFIQYVDKPTILNLVYYRCPGICSPIMNSLKDVVDKLGMEAGKDYQVLTVSFDHREGIDLAISKKANYFRLLKTKINPEGWKFFVADSMNIRKLTNTVGFYFKLVGSDYLHPGTLIILSPQGKVTRYLYGTFFMPFEVKLALAEASKGKAGPTINRVLQFCYTYDPAGRQYTLNVTRVSAFMIIGIGLLFLLVLLFKPRKKQVQTNKEE